MFSDATKVRAFRGTDEGHSSTIRAARTFDAHPTGTADLFGLRLAILHETDRGRRLAEGTLKRLTGGDRVKARRMREDFWSFEPSHTFVMLTNHRPVITGTDEGMWRRIRLVPWNVVIPAKERDEHLGDKLALEADHILIWLIHGCRDWQTGGGLKDPKEVTDATAAYKATPMPWGASWTSAASDSKASSAPASYSGLGRSGASMRGVPVVIAEKTTNIADLRGCGLDR